MDENLCPLCGAKMKSRLNRANNTRFWGCTQYPYCVGTRDVEGRAPRERRADPDEEAGRKYDPAQGLPSVGAMHRDRRRWEQ